MRSLTQLLFLCCCLAGAAQGLRQKKDHHTTDYAASADESLFDLYDEDIAAPPGPKEGWPHTEPFHTTTDEQLAYNKALDAEFHMNNQELMLSWQHRANVNIGNQESKTNPHNLLQEGIRIHRTHIARPEGATTGYYTGVTHFRHVNDPNLITFLFSAGRHDGGSNTFLTIDTTEANPFSTAQEMFLDEDDVSTYTWVSAYTQKDTHNGSSILHYALFSGGSNFLYVGPSKLYVFEEDSNGALRREPQVLWVEEYTQRQHARMCLLEDLGNIYDDDDSLVSMKGQPDIIITGTGGLDIYSSLDGNSWHLTRTLPLVNQVNHSNPTGTAAFMGVTPIQNRYLVISSRASWKIARENELPDAPCLVYDYQKDIVVQTFSWGGQSMSVAAIGDGSQILLGNGGEAFIIGQPNLLYQIQERTSGEDGIDLELSDVQLFKGESTLYVPLERVDPTPDSSSEYYSTPRSDITKTRQVKSFPLLNDSSSSEEIVLEVNSAETCNLYYRKNEDYVSMILPLPGSEGYISEFHGGVYARGGDVLMLGDKVFVVLANYNGNNTVYSFDSQWLRDEDVSLAEE